MFRLKGLRELLVVLTLSALVPGLQAAEMVSVNRPTVNMREGAGTNHSIVWVLDKGYPLRVTGRKGKWLEVRDFENDTGWVYRPLVARTPHVIVKAEVANIRSASGTHGRILGKAVYGEVLRTLAHRNAWVKVRRESGLVGWIARRLVWGW